jgi:hypothetical protein
MASARRRAAGNVFVFASGALFIWVFQRALGFHRHIMGSLSVSETTRGDLLDDHVFGVARETNEGDLWARVPIPYPANFREPITRDDFIALESSGRADPAPPPKPYITACVIIKDAVETLPEFVLRNRLAGIDHFVLVDDSALHIFELVRLVLRPLTSFVTLLRSSRHSPATSRRAEWTEAAQMTANLDCARSVAPLSEWVAFIDVDEFFEASVPEDFDLLRHPENKFLRRYLRAREHKPVPGVSFLWRTVLTNGQIESVSCNRTLGMHFPMACNATRFLGVQQNPLARSKTIARVKYLDFENTPLDDRYAHLGYVFLPPFADYHCNSTGTENDIVLVHYWSGSLFDYVRKVARGRPRRTREKRPIFELLLREFLCTPHMPERSSLARASLVNAEIRKFGYKCDASFSVPLPAKELLAGVRDSGALSYMVSQIISGRHFNLSQYDADTQLSFKTSFAGFLSHLDSVPWVHYYLYGFSNFDPATRTRWFTT